MASHNQFFNNHSNLHLHLISPLLSSSSPSSSLCTEKQPTCSTTQNCLFKILRTISTVPSESTIKFQTLSNSQVKDSNNGVEIESFEGLDIDLNVGFVASLEDQESDTPIVGENSGGVVAKCTGECEVVIEEKSEVSSSSPCEILESCKLVSDGVSEITKIGKFEEEEKGFMGMLIEAARLIFGEFKDEDSDFETEPEPEPEPEKKTAVHNSSSRTKQLKRKNKCWGVEYVKESTVAPVIRSKRGRIQVLPCKYRDSVVEPLTRFSRNRSPIVGNRQQGRSLRENT